MICLKFTSIMMYQMLCQHRYFFLLSLPLPLPLGIETGRFVNLPLEQRLCKICNIEDIEDEWHFLFKCTKFDYERERFFNNIVTDLPEFGYFKEEDQLKYLF